jgi:hypothetical protein
MEPEENKEETVESYEMELRQSEYDLLSLMHEREK